MEDKMTLKYVKFRLRNQTELALLNRETSTNYISCIDYIRGSRLYGAFGNALLLQTGKVNEVQLKEKSAKQVAEEIDPNNDLEKLFKRFFTSSEFVLSFSDALLCSKNIKVGEAVPPLLTLTKCRVGKKGENTNKRHIQEISNSLLQKQISKNPLEKNLRILCSKCGSPLKKSSTLLYYDSSNKKLIKGVPAKISTKVGIARHPILKSVKKVNVEYEAEPKGQMFTMEYLDRGQEFEFYATYDSNLISDQDIIEFIELSGVGAKRNSGFGKIDVYKIKEISEEKLIEELYDRYNQWSIQDNHHNSDKDYSKYIPFFLYSDYIPTSYQDQFEEIKLKTNWEIHQLRAKTTGVGIFIALDGNTPQEYKNTGWSRGSCFYLHIKEKLNKEDCKTLIKARIKGIGELSHRGFGEIRFLPKYFIQNEIIED